MSNDSKGKGISGEIGCEMEALVGRIGVARASLKDLEDRLDVILYPASPEPKSDERPESATHIGRILRDFNAQVEALINHINSIQERIAL